MSNTQFKVLEPIAITDAKYGVTLVDLNEPEPTGPNPDPIAWNAATAYAIGDRVTRATTHSIYERLTAGTSATLPESDAANWAKVRATNKWAMFDLSNSTQTQKANSFSFYVFLGAADAIDHIVFDNVDADAIRVTAWRSDLVATLGYDRTISLKSRSVRGWWQYFFNRFVYRTQAVFDNLPPLAGIAFAVTVFKTGGVAKVGTCVLGRAKNIGTALSGSSVGIRDYSTKDTDRFGNTAVVQRPFSKRMDFSVQIDSPRVDEVENFLAKYRAVPAVYMGAGTAYSSAVMYGYYTNFGVVIGGPVFSQCNVQVEGLTQ